MIAREVWVICTNGGQHATRELALLVPYRGRPSLVAMGLPEPDPDATRRGFVVRGGRLVTREPHGATPGNVWGNRLTERNKAWTKEGVAVTDATAGPVVELPKCPKCGRVFNPVRVALLEAIGAATPGDRFTVDVSK